MPGTWIQIYFMLIHWVYIPSSKCGNDEAKFWSSNQGTQFKLLLPLSLSLKQMAQDSTSVRFYEIQRFWNPPTKMMCRSISQKEVGQANQSWCKAISLHSYDNIFVEISRAQKLLLDQQVSENDCNVFICKEYLICI